MIPTHRILTRKSKLKFGKWKDYTVQELLNLKKYVVLISPYYKFTSINYIEDILIELKITEEFRIPKPSRDIDIYKKFMSIYYPDKRRENSKLEKMKKLTRPLTKGSLQNRNHGHKY